jgi:hypothetical protein
MTASEGQRRFAYPAYNGRRDHVRPDTFSGMSKSEKRDAGRAMTYLFLIDGGSITKAAPTLDSGRGRPLIFARDTGKTSDATYSRYFAGSRDGALAITGKRDHSKKAKAAFFNGGANHHATDTGVIGYTGPIKKDGTPRDGRNLSDDASARIRDTAAMRSGETTDRDERVTGEIIHIEWMSDPDAMRESERDWTPDRRAA